MTTANQAFAMDLWDACQLPQVQCFAKSLWRGDTDRAADGIQEALLRALTREDWFDAAKGKLTTWLMLTLKSVRQAERSKGHRRGTVAEPRVTCPGEDAIPALADLCDPESILIAREIDLDDVAAHRARKTTCKLTPAQVRVIRASKPEDRSRLARRFGVHPTGIWLAKTGRTYKHVV